MTTIRATETNGEQRTLESDAGASVMETLRDHDLVLGTCGGMCSCGTCHVYMLSGGETLEPATEEERDMLEALADIVEIRPNSRLSCQIVPRADIAELQVEIGPQF